MLVRRQLPLREEVDTSPTDSLTGHSVAGSVTAANIDVFRRLIDYICVMRLRQHALTGLAIFVPVAAIGVLTHLTRHLFHGPAIARALLLLVLCGAALTALGVAVLLLAGAGELVAWIVRRIARQRVH